MSLRAFALAAALPGCALVPPRVGEPPPVLADADAERAYRAVLEASSARAEIYAGLDSRAFVGMTWQSAAFREARTRREAAFGNWPAGALQAALERERAVAGSSEEFLLGVHVEDRRYDDFDRPGSAWRLVLEGPGGVEVMPSSVERVGRVGLPLRALYPYLGEFWVAYRVRFPARDEAGRAVLQDAGRGFTVKLGSALGQAKLAFPASAEAEPRGR
ncbi:MAG: hypothetical protein RL653_1199 [Pseudomonadota bacterium]